MPLNLKSSTLFDAAKKKTEKKRNNQTISDNFTFLTVSLLPACGPDYIPGVLAKEISALDTFTGASLIAIRRRNNVETPPP